MPVSLLSHFFAILCVYTQEQKRNLFKYTYWMKIENKFKSVNEKKLRRRRRRRWCWWWWREQEGGNANFQYIGKLSCLLMLKNKGIRCLFFVPTSFRDYIIFLFMPKGGNIIKHVFWELKMYINISMHMCLLDFVKSRL